MSSTVSISSACDGDEGDEDEGEPTAGHASKGDVELGQGRDEADGGLPFTGSEACDLAKEIRVRELSEREIVGTHIPLYRRTLGSLSSSIGRPCLWNRNNYIAAGVELM